MHANKVCVLYIYLIPSTVSALWSDHRRDPELISGLIVPVLSIVLRNSMGLMWLLCMLSFYFVSAPGFVRLFGVGVM